MALFFFHLRVGTRLALRTLFPLLIVFFAFYYLLGPEFFHSLLALFIAESSLFTGSLFAGLTLTIAALAARRVCLGLCGWIRHLPAKSQTHRRLAGLAILLAQAPILLTLSLLVLIASKMYKILALSVIFATSASALQSLSLLIKTSSLFFKIPATIYLLGLPFLGLASALCVLPVKRKILTRPMLAMACFLVASGNWEFFLTGILLLIISDRISGSLQIKKWRLKFRWSFKGLGLTVIISLRALRLKLFLPYILALIIFLGTALFISNNILHPPLSTKAVLFGGAFGLIMFFAILANMLASLRPPWPWIRSLPWSSQQRIVQDAIILSLLATPLLVLTAEMSIKALFPLLASLPLLAVHSSGIMRKTYESVWGAAGIIFLLGLFGALLLSLIPLVSIPFLALAIPVLKESVKREKCQKVSRWLELHHLAAGDSLSWSQS